MADIEKTPKKKKTKAGALLRGILSAMVLCAAALALISYQVRERGDGGQQTETAAPETDFVTESADTQVQTDTGAETEQPEQSGEMQLADIPKASELAAQGYVLSTKTYEQGNTVVASVDMPFELPEDYSLRGGLSTEGFSTVPVLRSYMGYLLYDDGGCIYALDALGNTVASGLDSLSPAYVRDDSGNPLFKADGKYYYINDGEGTLSRVNYDPTFGATLEYAYPREYSENPAKLYRYYVDTEEVRIFSLWEPGLDITDYINRVIELRGEEQLDNEFLPDIEKKACSVRLWGYVDENGEVAIEAKYHYATAFNSDGYAFVGDHSGRMQMIDASGKVILDAFGQSFTMEAEEQKLVVDGYYFPEKYSEASLGMFRFDHGLMRVVRRFYDYYSLDELISEEDALVYRDGRVFAIPEGFTLCAYSDGVLLLRRDGRYGYMDHTGRWIYSPSGRYAKPFYEGLAVVADENGRLGMIDTEGNTVLPFKFIDITSCSDGVIAAYSSDLGWTVYNKMELAG